MVREFGRKGTRTGNGLKRRLEEFGDGVADRTGEASEGGHAEGDVGNDADGSASRLVDDAHGYAGNEEHAVDQDDAHDPLPALQLLRREHVRDQGRDEAAEGDSGNCAEVGARGHDCRDGVEDAEQALRVVVGVDLPHGAAP